MQTLGLTHAQSMDDQCPVCKSDRFLNPKLRVLVSSACYHKMCVRHARIVGKLADMPFHQVRIVHRPTVHSGPGTMSYL
jgi:hypothetical protein